jgi:tryptophan-rich sensory protein
MNETQGSWYESKRTSLTLPNWVFPVVWNILFVLIALSLFYAYTEAKTKTLKGEVFALFGINMILNASWSILFFKIKSPGLALVDLALIWISIIVIMIKNWNISRKSSWLLLPYLLWVSFAGILNFLAI